MRAMYNALHARLNSCCCKASCFQQALSLFLCGLCTNSPRLCGGESPTCCCKFHAHPQFVSVSPHCIKSSKLQQRKCCSGGIQMTRTAAHSLRYRTKTTLQMPARNSAERCIVT